jgi:hypothetical protein
VWRNPNELVEPYIEIKEGADKPIVIKTYDRVRRCIVNLATGKYIDGQYRLLSSLDGYFGDPFLLNYTHEFQVGAPSHSDNPYAFKIYAIEEAQRYGCNQILWLDASLYAVKDISPVWQWLDDHDIFLEEAGHWAGTWSPQYVLDYFKITKDEAMKMPMFSAGFVGLDFRKEISREFFARWKNAMLAGMFKGSWSDHRHDMTVGSIIANQMGLVDRYSPGGQFFAYVGPGYSEPKPTACFHLRGI